MDRVVNPHGDRVVLWSGTIKGEAAPTWFVDVWEGSGRAALSDRKSFYVALIDAEEAARGWGCPLVIEGEAA